MSKNYLSFFFVFVFIIIFIFCIFTPVFSNYDNLEISTSNTVNGIYIDISGSSLAWPTPRLYYNYF